MGCLWCGKYSRQCKTMPSGPPEFIPPFIPVTGMKCSYGKISSPLTEISVGKTEISGTEPARPLIWTHRKFYKGFRGEARSRKPGQPGQPGSYEEALNHIAFWRCSRRRRRSFVRSLIKSHTATCSKYYWGFFQVVTHITKLGPNNNKTSECDKSHVTFHFLIKAARDFSLLWEPPTYIYIKRPVII